MAAFRVTRQVLFDRLYHAGEIYEGNASEVAHLIENGVLSPVSEKAERVAKNKADRAAPNKGD